MSYSSFGPGAPSSRTYSAMERRFLRNKRASPACRSIQRGAVNVSKDTSLKGNDVASTCLQSTSHGSVTVPRNPRPAGIRTSNTELVKGYLLAEGSKQRQNIGSRVCRRLYFARCSCLLIPVITGTASQHAARWRTREFTCRDNVKAPDIAHTVSEAKQKRKSDVT